MITVNLKGGLGNQMFQYTAGRALALRNNDELRLIRQDSESDIARPFSLQNFRIAGDIVNSSKLSWQQRLSALIEQKLFREFSVNFRPEILKKRGDVYLDGYFQSEKYFADFSATIREDLELKEPLTGEVADIARRIKNDEFAISLHVRRGDYVSHAEFGGIADLDYYNRAISKMNELLPQAHFYVFSDDIAWCRDNLPLPAGTVFVSKPEMKDYEELILMSMCRHNIIANSSFSWWGAWLNSHSRKIVIAPNRWSNYHDHDWYRDIIPEKWIRV